MAILQQVQNPSRCQRVEDLGSALEDWLSKKRQYEMFTDRNGRPCQASDDSLVAAMFRLMPKSLEETVMFANEDEGFQELCDRLLAYISTKQSIQMSENKKTTKNDDSMDVDALSNGKSKGKCKKGSSGKGKGSKGQNNTSDVVCWYCGRYGHFEKDCRQKWWSRGKGWSDTGAQADEHADGWTWSGEHVDGLWKTSDWQTGTGPGWRTTANDWTPWESEEPVGGFEINGTERCWSKTPRRGTEQRVRRWQRPRREEGARDQEATHSSSATVEMNAQTKKRQTVIIPTPTEQRVMVPPEIPHDTRTCAENLHFDESDSDELREEREVQDECRRWNAQTRASAATWVKEASKLLRRDFQGVNMESEEDPDGEVLTMDEWKQLCVKVDRLEGGMEHETEGPSSAYDESYADNEWQGDRQ